MSARPLLAVVAVVSTMFACSQQSASPASPAASQASSDASAPTDGGAVSPADTGAASGALDVSPELDALRTTNKVPALAAAAWVDGKLVAHGATGVRKLGDPATVTLADKWHLGSCTKAMTATLVGMFVEEGKLSWTTTMPALFPDATVHAGFAPVTIEMLLEHIGGFPATDPTPIWEDMWSSAEKGEAPEVTRKRVVYATLGAAPAVTPGTFDYSNTGYVAAGAALERIAGKPWETIIRDRIFTPLGMSSCGFGPAATAPASVDQPWGHEEQGTLTPIPPDVHGDNPAALGPAGTVHCSLEDWGKFLNEHLAGARGESKLATKATFERLHTPPAGGDYAAGWSVVSRGWAGGTALNHSGSNTLNFATTWLAPAKGLVLVAASNAATEGAEIAVDGAFAPLVARFAK